MINGSSHPIQKLEAARNQLRTAIQLWFADGDPISIHTLTCAAYQIIHDIHANRGGQDLIFDSIFVKNNRRAEWIHAVKEHMNFFKHAEKDPNNTIEFNPSLTEPFLMLSLLNLESIGEQLTHEESVFIVWCCFHNPDWLSEQGQDAFINRISIKQLAQLREISRKDFQRLYKVAIGLGQ